MAEVDRAAPRETLVRGRVVTGRGVLEDGVVAVSGDRVTFVGSRSEHRGEHARDGRDSSTPSPEHWLLPGLVDVHNHGGGGASFSTGRPDAVARGVSQHRVRGTTSVVASTVTDHPEQMLAAVGAAAAAAARGEVAAVHVEGPFLAPGRCGAQDSRHLRPPDVGLARELLDAGRGYVRVMTLAPELRGAGQVAGLLLDEGVVPAVGHTEAEADLVRRTLARTHRALGRPGLVTHLFNAMPPLHHRAPGPVAGALSATAVGDAFVELVADGVHLDDATVRMVFDLLGAGRIVLVTDAMAAAGMPDGEYELGPQRVRVESAVARVAGRGPSGLAGGTFHLLDVVRRCVHAGVDLVEAVTAASSSPSAALGLDSGVGVLEAGGPADLVVTDADLQPLRVMRRGRWVD